MKAGTKATREGVFAVCNEMAKRGQIPTVREILKITRGSLSTITPLRDEWFKSFVDQFRDGRLISALPPEVSDKLVSVWLSATEYANQALSSERLALASKADADSRIVLEAEHRADRAQQDLLNAQEEARLARIAQLAASALLGERAAEHQGIVTALTEQLQSNKDQMKATSEAHAVERARFDEDRKRLLLQIDSHRQDIAHLAASNLKQESQVGELTRRLSQDAARCLSLEEAAAQSQLASSRALERETIAQAKLVDVMTQRDALAAQLEAKEALLASQAQTLSTQTAAAEALASGFEQIRNLISTAKPVKRVASSKRA